MKEKSKKIHTVYKMMAFFFLIALIAKLIDKK
jgi:hypothetical protein